VNIISIDKRQQVRLLQIVTHIGALLPLALLLWDFWWGYLSADPIREAILRTGKPALVLLILSLACTPLNTLFGWKQLLPLRKPLGLYAFMYVCLHLSIFVAIDYGFNWELLREDLFEKRYALAGFAAFLLLVPLAATSTRWAMRKLGKNWKRLHRLVYLAGILAVVHYLWLVKADYAQPLLFAGILAALLLLRLKPIRQKVSNWKRYAAYRQGAKN
jgi:methionine sulfoxide reductase heme-binding subunit